MWGWGACVCVCGGGAVSFSSRFSSDRKPENFFFHSLRAKLFFSGQSKNKIFFSKQHICSKCIFSDLYVRVFLEPNIHGYNIHGYNCLYVRLGSEDVGTY